MSYLSTKVILMKFSNLEGSVSEGSGSPLHVESHYGLYQHLSYFSASVVVLPCLGHIFVDTSEDFSQDLIYCHFVLLPGT